VTRKRDRTERREHERAARKLVRDRERLAALTQGGAKTHPIAVDSAAVIENRARALPCPQCEGEYRIVDHRSEGPGLRAVDVRCQQCGVARTLWFRIVVTEPS
jgi:predicted Zn finger-like uncharacterized protein